MYTSPKRDIKPIHYNKVFADTLIAASQQWGDISSNFNFIRSSIGSCHENIPFSGIAGTIAG